MQKFNLKIIKRYINLKILILNYLLTKICILIFIIIYMFICLLNVNINIYFFFIYLMKHLEFLSHLSQYFIDSTNDGATA